MSVNNGRRVLGDDSKGGFEITGQQRSKLKAISMGIEGTGVAPNEGSGKKRRRARNPFTSFKGFDRESEEPISGEDEFRTNEDEPEMVSICKQIISIFWFF